MSGADEGNNDEASQSTGVMAILGDWGDLLQQIPGAAKAVTKLVGSTAAAGSAWIDVATARGEQQAAEVRGVTDARKKVREAMTKAAVKQVSGDPDLGRRALEHFAEEIVSNQANREAVTKGALRMLALDPPKEAPEAEIGDDWLRAFSIYAERASSEAVRAHWSAILAGEIRKPGSVSLLTIQMMSVIDANGAELIQKYLNFVLNGQVSSVLPTFPRFAKEPAWDEILALDALGFLHTGMNVADDNFFTCGHFSLKIFGEENLVDQYYLQCSVLTRAGREIVNLLGQSPTLEHIKGIRKEIVDGVGLISFDILDSQGNIVSPASDYPSHLMVLDEQQKNAAKQSAVVEGS